MRAILVAMLLAIFAGSSRADDEGPYTPQPGWIYCPKPGSYRGLFTTGTTDHVAVAIEVISYRERFPRGPKVHVRWGTDGGVPDTLIGQLEIKVNGTVAPLQLADFDYLGNPVSLKAWLEKGLCMVELQGGDAAGSYNCFWTFRYFKASAAWLPIKRLIQAGEFPQQVQESTTFKYDENLD